MRVRAQDASGDMTFGQGSANFLVNSPAAVGQLLGDRMGLWTAEWFVDQSDGVPWSADVLGTGTASTRDPTVKTRILQTTGVTSIESYTSAVNPDRTFTPAVTVDTQFSGQVTVPLLDAPPTNINIGSLDWSIDGNTLLASAG
jgi:hypothetical protein